MRHPPYRAGQLVAFSVTAETPAPLGVPEIKPEEAFTVRPVGNPDAP
jgi:hypothetical protein